MKPVKRLFLGMILGFVVGGCASTPYDQQSYFDSPPKQWMDQMTHNRDRELVSDWEILDLSQQSIGLWGDTMGGLGSDIGDVLY